MNVLGIRNNNPGNIRRSKDPWQGLAPQQSDKQFFQFTAPVWGIRAMARVLMTYRDKYGCMTITDLISKWAPPSENNTQKYIETVSKLCNVGALSFFDVQQYDSMRLIIPAMIRVECGQMPYDALTIDKALELAGIVKEPPASKVAAIAKNPTAAITIASGAASTIGTTISQVSGVWDTVSGVVNIHVLLTLLALVSVGAVAYVVYDLLRKRKAMGF